MISKIFWPLLRWILFRFDAETAHQITFFLIKLGIRLNHLPLHIVSGCIPTPSAQSLPQVFGIPFLSRLGLASGFDKNAEILEGLPALGFGFAEIGTITPLPQPGNDRPRIFRNPNELALFNRLGFNNVGATLIAKRLSKVKPMLPENFRVGVNVGKNKDTPLENAAQDYVRAVSSFEGLADYLVINVSSPNTPGLRSLQNLENLRPIILETNAKISSWSKRPPLLLKLSPEIESSHLSETIQKAESWGIDGWILTNTSFGTWKNTLSGGWSGKPLSELSKKRLIEAKKVTEKPVLSVGGVFNEDEALSRLKAGADLIEIYTGWIYQGPQFPKRILQKISKIT